MSDDQNKTPEVGQVWLVRAWWLKDELVECRIESISVVVDLVHVRPLTGNPHSRGVRSGALDSRIGGHPAELLNPQPN